MISATIKCNPIFNVSVLKAKKLYKGTSCSKKNTGELDPLRAGSPDEAGLSAQCPLEDQFVHSAKLHRLKQAKVPMLGECHRQNRETDVSD